MTQLRLTVAEQEDVMMRLQVDSQHGLSRQHEEHAHKQHALFHEFDSLCLVLQQHTLLELEQARMDAERMANMSRPVFADGPSTQRFATPVEKEVNAVAAVAHAVPTQAHSPGLSLSASAGNMNLRARNFPN